MSALPTELLFKIMLPLDYTEIINYCQTNQSALQICQSEYFWQMKAQQDYNVPLNLLFGETPNQRYLDLKEITSAPIPAEEAFRRGQTLLLGSADFTNFDPSVLIDALENGHYERIKLYIASSKQQEKDVNYYLNGAYNEALALNNFYLLPYLSNLGEIDYIDALSAMWTPYENYAASFAAIITDASAHGVDVRAEAAQYN